MSKYSTEDFASAEFAKHPDGRLALRGGFYPNRPWEDSWGTKYTDESMTHTRFSIVPSSPTFTQGQWDAQVADQPKEWVYGFTHALDFVGAKCVPDPEPTNAELIDELLAEFAHLNASCGGEQGDHDLAEFLDARGVRAGGDDE